MAKKHILFLSCICLMLLWFYIPTAHIHACGGFHLTPLDRMVREADIVIKARIIQVDAYQQNAIIHADSYLIGTGPEYLLFSQTHPIRVHAFAVKMITTDECDAMPMNLSIGDTIYTMLVRNQDGSYRTAIDPYIAPAVFKFPNPNATLAYQTDTTQKEKIFNERQFVDYILKFGRSRLKPATPSTVPLPAPLLITTDKESNYLLPVDGKSPQKIIPLQGENLVGDYANYLDYFLNRSARCTENGCRSYSLDGLYKVILQDNEVYICQFRAVCDTSYPEGIEGSAFVISPTSQSIAIWQPEALTIYRLMPQFSSLTQELNSIPLTQMDTTASTFVVWSRDGQTIFYNDKQGLWAWKVFETAVTPRLILSANKVNNLIEPLDVSALGNYLTVKVDTEIKLLNVNSGKFFPGHLISPDEQYLLSIEDDNETISVCNLHSPDDWCQQHKLYSGTETQLVGWKNSTTFYVTSCYSEASQQGPLPCEKMFLEINMLDLLSGGVLDPYRIKGDLFAIEANTGTIAAVQDKTTVTIDGINYTLAQYLDGNIREIQWLPSLTYQGLSSAYNGDYTWRYLSDTSVAK